ncbi:MAG TPA: (4Fe-4S)-binding protein [Candidatus Anaerotruncus excrementipullorum]|uniref:(4Fe-4S)-binding protein n=1 Tax=Candidatus Anaerotruncus excrementipullorum TaxID=2838465 RepID=A0A9D2B7I1_9FIRM|nr:(4Fe-4S)-binding protein [Candidatus Anaerotruncus excrementipullorum]
MGNLTAQQVMEVKGKGFLRNRGTDLFSGRLVAPGTVFTAQNMEDIAHMARTMGNGKVLPTSRLTVEIPGIPYERIPEAMAYAQAHGMRFGGTGAKIRPVAACKGTTCVYGNFDTQELARKIHEAYYLGWTDVALPHKFKITVGGCPNSCMKPSLNDFGVEGHRAPRYNPEACRGCKVCGVENSCPMKCAVLREGKLEIDQAVCNKCGVCLGKCPFHAVEWESPVEYQLFFGGTWGKRARLADPLPHLVGEEEILPYLEKSILWFKENAYQKERFGLALERVGFEKFLQEIQGDSLLQRKQEILSAPIKTRA